MYRENVKSINAFVGCGFNCIYCKPSFQRLMKRSKCEDCRNYTPHYHEERLDKTPPKTEGKEFIFFPSCGDISFADTDTFNALIDYTKKYSDRTFLIQSKNPKFFVDYTFPNNVILGTTIETNKVEFETPSKYTCYEDISQAPIPSYRFLDFKRVMHKRKEVTVEPIIQFDLNILTTFIKELNPEFVYIGYANHNVHLPDPTLQETLKLIDILKEFTEVRLKTIRKSWWE